MNVKRYVSGTTHLRPVFGERSRKLWITWRGQLRGFRMYRYRNQMRLRAAFLTDHRLGRVRG